MGVWFGKDRGLDLRGGATATVAETPNKKVKTTTAKECYTNACKKINSLNAQLKKMRKTATTPQELKLLSNLEGKVLNLI